MTKDQYEACWEHSYKDCNKCLFIECPYATDDGDDFEQINGGEQMTDEEMEIMIHSGLAFYDGFDDGYKQGRADAIDDACKEVHRFIGYLDEDMICRIILKLRQNCIE